MTWTAGTSLIADLDELRVLLGPHDFENLEAGIAGYDLDDLLTRASDEVRAMVVGAWSVDPAVITNTGDYKPAVAAHVKAQLTIGGFFEPPAGQVSPIDPAEWSEPRVRRVQPTVSSGDRPAGFGQSLPKVRNVNRSYF